MDPALVDAEELELAGKCGMVFATAAPLAERLRAANPKARFIPNGANFERFYQASQPQPVPSELAALPHPIFGFVGALQPCIEYGFVEHAAKAHPEWSFVWIGGEKPGADVSALKALPNCHFLGIKPNEQLPQYLAHFDVCLNLFASGPLSKDVSPLKFYEYLATGKPIVSTRQPDQILQYAPLIHIADTADEFVEKCAEARSDTQPRDPAQRENSLIGKKEHLTGDALFRYSAVLAQPVQLCDGGIQASFLLGKKASIGNSICPKTSHGLSAPETPEFGHCLVGMQ